MSAERERGLLVTGDAPRMTAMGSAGNDAALETADVALMGDDLSKLADALHLARRTRRVVRQNLVLSFAGVGNPGPGSAAGRAEPARRRGRPRVVGTLGDSVRFAAGLRRIGAPQMNVERTIAFVDLTASTALTDVPSVFRFHGTVPRTATSAP